MVSQLSEGCRRKNSLINARFINSVPRVVDAAVQRWGAESGFQRSGGDFGNF